MFQSDVPLERCESGFPKGLLRRNRPVSKPKADAPSARKSEYYFSRVRKVCFSLMYHWRGARVVESAGLENRSTLRGIESSNLSLSASFKVSMDSC